MQARVLAFGCLSPCLVVWTLELGKSTLDGLCCGVDLWKAFLCGLLLTGWVGGVSLGCLVCPVLVVCSLVGLDWLGAVWGKVGQVCVGELVRPAYMEAGVLALLHAVEGLR